MTDKTTDITPPNEDALAAAYQCLLDLSESLSALGPYPSEKLADAIDSAKSQCVDMGDFCERVMEALAAYRTSKKGAA